MSWIFAGGGASDDGLSVTTSQAVSSHYAQISPLRPEGLPPAGRMGLNTNINNLKALPLKSYFQVDFTIYILHFQKKVIVLTLGKQSY